jgi:hypothetical protein
MRSDQFGSITSKNSSSSSFVIDQALRLEQHQRAVLVNDDVREHQLRVQQMHDLLDQRAEDGMVFVLDVRQGGDLRRLLVFHRRGSVIDWEWMIADDYRTSRHQRVHFGNCFCLP